MPDVSIFNLGGQNINVKDGIARSNANQALQLVQEIEQFSRVTVSCEQQSETITITTATHEGG